MFGLKKKKKINEAEIKSYKEALEAINIFILLSEWNKAKNALEEIKIKERESFEELIEKINEDPSIEAEKEKLKIVHDYNKKEKTLLGLEQKIRKAEDKYKDKTEKEQFKIRFKNIKTEINNLIGNGNPHSAMKLLQNFLEENKDNSRVISFFNTEKKRLHRFIEKQRGLDEKKFKENAKMHAMRLIGGSIHGLETQEEKEEKEKSMNIFQKISSRLNFYKNLKDTVRKKRLLDEINLLIEEDSRVKNEIAEKKLENIHKGLIKELNFKHMLGYDIYGKILGSDKISGDTFDIYEGKNKYNFFLGDATGHGIRAGLIVTLLSRLFKKHVEKDLQSLGYEINNGLKQDLKNRNFITGIFFETFKETPNKINFIGMGHEPILIYRRNEKKVEKIIPGGLAAGIRIINDKENIKVKTFELSADDILLTYSDGIIEHKDSQGELYGLNRLIEAFQRVASVETNIHKIYEYLIHDVQAFKGGSHFEDDLSVLLLRRDPDKDLLNKDSQFIEEISAKENLSKRELKKLQGKTKDEAKKELEKIKKDKDTQRIIKVLENLYYTGEILKLKQEAIRYIKSGYIHKKINWYLKKAIDNEMKYKIDQKNQKMSSKYMVLSELYKKGDYQTVINEIEDIIAKDGNI